MSSQFTRSSYDQVKTDSNLVQSTKPGYLVFNTIQQHPNQCYSANGPRNNRPNVSSELGVERTNLIGIESMLKGIGGELSRNIDMNTFINQDTKLANQYQNIPKNVPENCSILMEPSYTRLNPNEKLQEQSWNRYEYHIYDPMTRYFEGIQGFTSGNNRQGLSTRIDVHKQLEEKNKVMRKLAGKIQNPLNAIK